MKHRSSPLTLPEALSWIVGSLFITLCCGLLSLKYWEKKKWQASHDQRYAITHIIQTGPQREALKLDYLAELLGLSEDATVSSLQIDLKKAREKLLSSPLIEEAQVKVASIDTLYIDYRIRQPIAFLGNFQNVALDRHGYPFPFTPFYAPKNLPEIYLSSITFFWNQQIVSKELQLAFDLLRLCSDFKIRDLLPIQRIDVSKAFLQSSHVREIILVLEDEIVQKKGLHEVKLIIPRILRLTPKRYPEELGNYLKLREKLLAQEVKLCPSPVLLQPSTIRRQEVQVIDFRLKNLAFIDGCGTVSCPL